MKIIISENNLNAHLKRIIDELGFHETCKMTHLSSYELAKKSNYKISRDYYIYFDIDSADYFYL